MRLATAALVVICAIFYARGQVTFIDDFATPIDYLTNGIRGTIWDGIYLGAGDIANATSAGAAAGSVSLADASVSSNGVLTIASLHTDWENAADDGVLFFKVITGDFDMSVRVLGPIDTGNFNLPGLMVRAFGPGGAPAPNGAENSFLWARFDNFNIANMRKNNVNGVKTDTALGAFPNSNYWLRVQRTGSTFNLYEKAAEPNPWTLVGNVTRADFDGRPLQVGIQHAVYAGGATRVARYDNFSLNVSNLSLVTPPGPASALTITNAGTNRVLSWVPGAASSGSLVAMWTGVPIAKQAPASGTTYNGNAAYGLGDTLPGGAFVLQVAGDFGPDYTIQKSTNLVQWNTVLTTNSPMMPFQWTDPNSQLQPAAFYRVTLGP